MFYFVNFLTCIFLTCRDEHAGNVLTSMQTIMELLFEEREDVPESLVLILLSVLGGDKKVSISFLSCTIRLMKN